MMYSPKDLKSLPPHATGPGASAISPVTLRHRGLAEAAEADDLASVLRLLEAGATMADAALAYARLGIPVFPCSPNGKEPLVGESAPGKGDGGVYRATTDSTQLRAWWKKWPLAMIGAPMGRASGFVLVDLDPAPGQGSCELLEQLRDRLGGKLASGLVAHTPRGGMHLFYAMPTDATIGNRANLLKVGKGRGKIDIRGDGGYAILAPSQRRGAKARQDGCDGGFYRWDDVEGPCEDFALPPLPQSLIDLITRPYEPELVKRQAPSMSSAKRLGGAGDRERRYALRALENETRELGQQIEGERNNALNLASMKLAQLVATGALSEVLASAALEEACEANGLTKDSGIKAVRATIASGFKKGLAQPRDLSGVSKSGAGNLAALRKAPEPREVPQERQRPRTLLGTGDGLRGGGEPSREPEAPSGDDRRAVIRIRPSFLHEAVDRAERILVETGPGPLYQRSGQLVHITDRLALRSDGAREHQQAIAFAEPAFYSRTLAQRARCERYLLRTNEWVPCDPKPEMALQYFATKQWKLPILRQIISSPTLRHDGSLLHRRGYDAATGLYLTEELPGLNVPERPTESDAQQANETLTDFLSSFPYSDPDGRGGQSLAVAMAGLLSGCSRAALELAPVIVVTAPAAGTGKSYLVDVTATIATGSRATCVATGSNIEEFEKSIGAELMNGRPFVLLDNLIQPLQGALLCQLMSQPAVELRDLGKSRNVSLSAGVSLYATGNNVQVRGDMTRRVLVCTLDSKMERPETRAFEHDLLAEAKRRRADLVSAALTMLKWRFCWQEDTPGPWERVADLVPHAGFTEWSWRIREPLIALGHADPVLSIEQARMTDGEADVLGTLLECWQATFGDAERSLRQAIELAQADLRDAIRAATRERDEPTPAKLGNYLGRVRDRPCGGKRFVVAKIVRGNRFWRVV